MDFPRAWEIARATPVTDHHVDCSYYQAGMLCDCKVLTDHPEYKKDYPEKAEYEGTAFPFSDNPFKPRAVVGPLCVCGEDLGEPNDGIEWQDWEQCPNCDLHVHHASWINEMVEENDELTIKVTTLDTEIKNWEMLYGKFPGGPAVDCSKLIEERNSLEQITIPHLRDKITLLEAKLKAHIENEGEECPLCVLEEENERLMGEQELAWGVIANAGGGDWGTQNEVWQQAACDWRDRYFDALKEGVCKTCDGEGTIVANMVPGYSIAGEKPCPDCDALKEGG